MRQLIPLSAGRRRGHPPTLGGQRDAVADARQGRLLEPRRQVVAVHPLLQVDEPHPKLVGPMGDRLIGLQRLEDRPLGRLELLVQIPHRPHRVAGGPRGRDHLAVELPHRGAVLRLQDAGGQMPHADLHRLGRELGHQAVHLRGDAQEVAARPHVRPVGVPKVPCRAVHARPGGPGDPRHHPALGVADREPQARRPGPRPLPQKLVLRTGSGRVELRPGGHRVLEVPGDDGPEVRVRGREEARPLRAPPARGADVEQRFLHREHVHRLLHVLRPHRLQRRVVVEHVDAAAEGRQHQVVLPLLDLQVLHRDRRQPGHAGPRQVPRLAAPQRVVRAIFGAHEQQPRADVVLDDRVRHVPLGQVGPDADPARPPVAGHQHVRLEVAVLVAVEGGVHGAGVVRTRPHARDVGHVRHAGERVDPSPGGPVVLGDLDQPVVGAHVDEPLDQRRFIQRDDVSVDGRRAVLRHRVHRPHAAHHLQLVAVDAAGEVAGDRPPVVAAVVRAVQPPPGEVQPAMVVRRDQQRRVPVEDQRGVAGPRLRLDVHRLAGAAVVSREVSVLPLAVDDVGIRRVHLRLEAVAAEGDEPVLVGDALAADRPRRPPHGVVVLRAAVDVVERLVVVHRHAVELRDGQVGMEPPGAAAVPGFVHAAVVADDEVVGVVRIDPQRVAVHVHAAPLDVPPGAAAVLGHVQEGVEHVHAIDLVRVAHDLVVIHRGRTGVVAHPRPRRAAIGAAEEAGQAVLRLDDRVDDVGVRRRDAQPDLAQVAGRQAAGGLGPRRAAVGGTPDARARPAVDHRPHVAATLPRAGVEHVGIAGIHVHLVDAGVLVDLEDAIPGRAPVARAVEAAVAAGTPQRALGGHVDRVGIRRVHQDAADVAGVLQAHVLP